MRKLMRSIARHNMKKAGAVQINKKGSRGKSKFAKYWRSYVVPGRYAYKGLAVRQARAHA